MFIIYNCSYEIDNLSYNLRNDKKDIDTIIQNIPFSKEVSIKNYGKIIHELQYQEMKGYFTQLLI